MKKKEKRNASQVERTRSACHMGGYIGYSWYSQEYPTLLCTKYKYI
jgi:hypothetical protein